MSIFDRIKLSLGLKKEKNQSAGHRLGGGDPVGGSEREILAGFPYEYDVEFKEEGIHQSLCFSTYLQLLSSLFLLNSKGFVN